MQEGSRAKDTTSYYRCTRCKLACDPMMQEKASGQTHALLSDCCLALVQVVSDKRP